MDDTRLWLPESYKSYYLKLVSAASKAEKTDKCKTLLKGTIHRDRSTRDHPVFKIICRNNQNKTYPVLIDGLTFEDLTPPEENINQISNEDIEKQRQQMFWEDCRSQLNEKTHLMLELEWLTTEMPEPEKLTDNSTEFWVDFNAKNIQRKTLRFRATCTVLVEEEASETLDPNLKNLKYDIQIKIGPRRRANPDKQ